MRVSILSLFALLQAYSVLAVSIPEFSPRDPSSPNELFKRKGGGGGGKGGGLGASTGVSSGGAVSGGGVRTGALSNVGGSTRLGSGTTRGYGGGGYYGGGAAIPYRAGDPSNRGLAPRTLLPIAALGFFGGAWLYGAYLYSYPRPYTYYNATTQRNETKPVQCLCQQYTSCGCDDQDDNRFLNDVIGNGTYEYLDDDLIRVADINGTSNLVLNGTLVNGTTAPGGVDDAGASLTPQNMGWLVVASAVTYAMWML